MPSYAFSDCFLLTVDYRLCRIVFLTHALTMTSPQRSMRTLLLTSKLVRISRLKFVLLGDRMQTYVSINLDKLCTVRLLFARADVSMYATGYFYCLYCHFFNPAFFPTLFIFFNVQTLLGELAVSICHFKLQHSSTMLFSRTEFENLGYFKSNLQKLSLYYLGLRNQSFN